MVFCGDEDLQRLHSLRNNVGSTASGTSKSSQITNMFGSREVNAQSNSTENGMPPRLFPSPVDQFGEADDASLSSDVLSKVHNRQKVVLAGMASEGALEAIQEKLDDIRRQVNSRNGDLPLGIIQHLEGMRTLFRCDPRDDGKIARNRSLSQGRRLDQRFTPWRRHRTFE
jgi:hypothetical protein